MKALRPTFEQETAINLFSTGKSLKINAYAGTGKTATLVLLSNSTRKQGVYLGFNRSLVDEARTKAPTTVTCRTTHQIAFHDTPEIYRQNRDKMFGTVNANYVAAKFMLDKLLLNKDFFLSARQRGALVLETVRRFSHSADCQISRAHVPVWGKMDDLKQPELEALQDDAVLLAKQLWRLMIDPYDSFPLGHDGYYKLWTLSDPVIPADYILLDEAQDSNPAMLSVLKRQQALLVYVGDKWQQIYQFRGAVNAMSDIQTVHESKLTLSFRFGQAIADAATRILGKLGEKDRIIGNPDIDSKLGCTVPRAILCRTNAGVIAHLLRAIESGIKPHVVGGNGEILRLLKAVALLKAGLPVDVPEFYGFSDWHSAVEFSETDEGAHLAMLVRLVGNYGENHLIAILSDIHQSEYTAPLVISTAHRAKGRQWPSVAVSDDFSLVGKSPDGREFFKPEELRLFYTAATRAQLHLQIPPNLASLFGIMQDAEPLGPGR